MNIQKILDKLIEKSNFRTGHMEDGKDVYDEIEVKVEDIKQSLEQAYKQGVESVVLEDTFPTKELDNVSINESNKISIRADGYNQAVQDLEDKKAKLLKE